MIPWKNEDEARNQIKELVATFYHNYKEPKEGFLPGDRINYSGRVYDEKEMLALTDAMLDFWLTSGRFSDEFEDHFSKMIGVRYAHLVNSGSSANLLALAVLTAPELGSRRICPGDEVITVAAAFPTTVTPILQYGAIPVFLDMKIPEYNIDDSYLESARTERTKAVFIAHTLGNPFSIKRIRQFCDQYGLWLIEDNCDALGSEYTMNGMTKWTGSWGDISTCSFYPPHHMTMGEGGCVCTDNPLLHRLILSYRDWGRDCICPSGYDNLCGRRFEGQFGDLPSGYDHKYVYSHLGYNLKATDLQASIGCAQIQKLPGFVKRRRENWRLLREALDPLSDKLSFQEPTDDSNPSWFGFLISVKAESGLSRNHITQYLEEHNIQTRLLFSGNIIKHPCFSTLHGTGSYRVLGNLKQTEYIMNNSFWIGVYPGLTRTMIEYMAKTIAEVLKQ